MNNTSKILALASIFCLVLLGSSAFAQGYSQEFPEGTVGAIYQPMGSFNTFEASWLIGHEVTTTNGGSLGQISSCVIDKTNGRIALVVLSDVPNLGDKVMALPFSSIVRTGEDTFEFNPGDMVIPAAPGTYDPDVYYLTWSPGTSALYGIPSVIDLAWVSYLYRHYGQEPYWTEKEEQSSMVMEFYESTRLMGAEVQTPTGEAVAQINDLVIDSSDGHMVFLALSHVAGRGDTLVAVPFGALSRSGEDVFVLNTTRDQLAAAPSFDEFADLSNLRYAESVYIYFGLQPYWTVGGEEEYMEP
jgi:sporulation protein YlmC with PRC-barrel domain